MTKRNRLQAPLGVLLFLFLTPAAFAQSPWLDQSPDRAIFLEIQKPNFTREYLGGDFWSPPLKTTPATSIVTLSARWRFSELFVLRTEIPFVNAGYADQTVYDPFGNPVNFGGISDNRFGNPLFGLEVRNRTSPLYAELGIRFSLLKSDPMEKIGPEITEAFGALIDYDRREAFLEDTWTFSTAAAYQFTLLAGMVLRLRNGFTFLVPTKNHLENELFIDYAPQVGYQFHRVGLLAGLTGRYLVSENGLNFGARTVHQLGVSANYTLGPFLPGAHFRLPLDDDLKRDLDFVFGVSLGYRLP